MEKRALIITDLGYGDAGKGTTVDFLTRRHEGALIIRHNGGSQAAHNVVTPDGRHHTFAQFGSGMFHPDARTYLSRYMILDPLAMSVEAQHLDSLGVADVRARTIIDPSALITTPFQAIVNRIRERSRDERHGSCGCGVGETVADSLEGFELRAGDLSHGGPALYKRIISIRARQLEKLEEIGRQHGNWRDYATLSEVAILTSEDALQTLCARYAEFAVEYVIADELSTLMNAAETVIFEGAQGTLLDEWYGFHPYTTWSTTTDANALALLEETGFDGQITRLGVVRTYMTRHGNGPFVTESEHLTASLSEPHNGQGEFQGAFRKGWFDAVALRYALAVNGGVDQLVVTHCDVPQEKWEYCTAYECSEARPSAYFSGNELEITGIRVKADRADLRHQEELTRYLGICKPMIRTLDIPGGNAKYSALCDAICGILNVPVLFASWGPTAVQKS